MAAQIGGEEWRLLSGVPPGRGSVAAEPVILHAGEGDNEASAKFKHHTYVLQK